MEKSTSKFRPAVIILGILIAIGVGAWIYQLINGLGVTGMNNGSSWGLYITCFMFFVGLSAGGLIVASSASIFGIKEYKKVAMPAIILSTVCICLAGMFVLIDLGGIHRVWEVIISPNVTSPLFWDICVIMIYLVINFLYLMFMKSEKPGSEHRVVIVSRFALPVAILVHSVTAWIFGLEIAREGWYSAIMAPLFVVSAMDSGLALLLLSLVGLNKTGTFKTEPKLISSLAGLLAVCIAIDGFLIGCEVLTLVYPGAAGAETFAIMATGSTAPFFWFEIIVGLFIPFLILVFAKNRQKIGLVVFSCICVVLGVFSKRVWLLFTSFIEPNIQGAPGIISGSSNAIGASGNEAWSLVGTYMPTVPEVLIVIGVISLGVLAFMVLSTKLLVSKNDYPLTDSSAASKASQAT